MILFRRITCYVFEYGIEYNERIIFSDNFYSECYGSGNSVRNIIFLYRIGLSDPEISKCYDNS